MLLGEAASGGDPGGTLSGVVVGGLLGALGVLITDDVVLAWDESAASTGCLLPPSFSVRSSFALVHDHAHQEAGIFGIAGTF